MHPTALVAGSREQLVKGLPEAESAVTNSQIGRVREPARLQIGQKFAPALGAFPKAWLETDQFFPALRRGADQDQNALLLVLHPAL